MVVPSPARRLIPQPAAHGRQPVRQALQARAACGCRRVKACAVVCHAELEPAVDMSQRHRGERGLRILRDVLERLSMQKYIVASTSRENRPIPSASTSTGRRRGSWHRRRLCAVVSRSEQKREATRPLCTSSREKFGQSSYFSSLVWLEPESQPDLGNRRALHRANRPDQHLSSDSATRQLPVWFGSRAIKFASPYSLTHPANPLDPKGPASCDDRR